MNEQPLKEDVLNTLRVLSSKEDLTQRDLSAHLGVSLGKTNYLLKELIRGGLIKITNFAKGDQKLKKMGYVLTKEGFHVQLQLTHHFLEIKEREYTELKAEAEKVSNGMNGTLGGEE
ncbi:MAG: MarR family EPS-associated transcriptional regulator [Candidatus Omnitrophica bacterium]|nr:MarR family EPS-associated transcriptional regulator [Candidatus Omnitrophota bacterium]